MPELPEVETIKRRLAEVLPAKQLAHIQVFSAKSFGGVPEELYGQTVTTVWRRAKLLGITFSSGLHVLTHLKMTGQLIFVDGSHRVGGGHPTADWTQSLPSKHTRISYTFADATQLHFNDQRLFGWMRVLDDAGLHHELAGLGPDINDPTLTAEYLYEQFQRRGIPLKVALMSNEIVCGVGNIYACDALNLARLSPFRPAKSLSFAEVETLLQATQTVIDRGINLQGTTFDGKYLTVDGMAGGYQERVLAYGREGQPCYNCGQPIQKIKLAGRGTYYCVGCQV
jgi:formamidopyrimidine-DNA glycosylase